MRTLKLTSPSLSKVPIPHFGTVCVCCSGETAGGTKVCVPRGRQIRGYGGLTVPVCSDCTAHAVERNAAAAGWIMLFIVGLGLTIGPAAAMAEPDAPSDLWVAVVIGIALLAWSVTGLVRVRLRNQRARQQQGHHPWLSIGIGFGSTSVNTTNPTLIETMVKLNPGSEVSG
jgi:hypothetical protein